MSCLCSGSMILRWYHDGYCAGITSKVRYCAGITKDIALVSPRDVQFTLCVWCFEVRYCAGITKDIALVSVRVMLMINVLIDNDCVLY